MNTKNTKKSPIHENTNANTTCDFGDDRCRITAARLKKDIYVRADYCVQLTYSSIDNGRSNGKHREGSTMGDDVRGRPGAVCYDS